MCKDTPFPDNNQEKQRKKKIIPIQCLLWTRWGLYSEKRAMEVWRDEYE